MLYRALYEDSRTECQFFFGTLTWSVPGSCPLERGAHGLRRRDRNRGLSSSVLVSGVEFRHSGAE